MQQETCRRAQAKQNKATKAEYLYKPCGTTNEQDSDETQACTSFVEQTMNKACFVWISLFSGTGLVHKRAQPATWQDRGSYLSDGSQLSFSFVFSCASWRMHMRQTSVGFISSAFTCERLPQSLNTWRRCPRGVLNITKGQPEAKEQLEA